MTIALDRSKLKKEMKERKWTFSELAKRLGVKNKQMAHYIITKGGVQYATELARVFKCNPKSLIVSTIRVPAGVQIVNQRVRITK